MKKETKTALLANIKNRDNLESLFAHEGWKIIEKFLSDKYNEAISRLKTVKDPTRDQALIAIIDDLMRELKLGIITGNQAQIVFQTIKEKEKNEYV